MCRIVGRSLLVSPPHWCERRPPSEEPSQLGISDHAGREVKSSRFLNTDTLLIVITLLSQFKIFSHLVARLYEHSGKGCRYFANNLCFVWYRFSFLQLGTPMMPVCGSKRLGFLSTCTCLKVNNLLPKL